MPHQYDYIIAGAGAAGLSLLTRMVASGKFSDKKYCWSTKPVKTVTTEPGAFGKKEKAFLKRSFIENGMQ